jgi:hypothetical protein
MLTASLSLAFAGGIRAAVWAITLAGVVGAIVSTWSSRAGSSSTAGGGRQPAPEL